jgi:hypothetical protein
MAFGAAATKEIHVTAVVLVDDHPPDHDGEFDGGPPADCAKAEHDAFDGFVGRLALLQQPVPRGVLIGADERSLPSQILPLIHVHPP